MKLADIKLGEDYYLVAPNSRSQSHGMYGRAISLDPFMRRPPHYSTYSRDRSDYVAFGETSYKVPFTHMRRKEDQKGPTQIAVLRVTGTGVVVHGRVGVIVEVVPVSHFLMTREERMREQAENAAREEQRREEEKAKALMLASIKESLELRFEKIRGTLPEHLQGEVVFNGSSVNMSLDTFEAFARGMKWR